MKNIYCKRCGGDGEEPDAGITAMCSECFGDGLTAETRRLAESPRRKVSLPRNRVVMIVGAESSIELAESCIALGAALRSLYIDWTLDDEVEGECANTGSGADVASDVFSILTRHGYKVN